jgi:copper(I)-binding protein
MKGRGSLATLRDSDVKARALAPAVAPVRRRMPRRRGSRSHHIAALRCAGALCPVAGAAFHIQPPPLSIMTRLLHRRGLLQAGLGLCAALAVPAVRANDTCYFDSPNLRIFHPWTRATGPEDRVAVVCMVFDEVTRADRLIGVHTPVAEGAEIGGPGARPGVDLPIAAGRALELRENGTHVRLLGLKHPLHVGRTYELTLVFEHGGAIPVHLDVDYERDERLG